MIEFTWMNGVRVTCEANEEEVLLRALQRVHPLDYIELPIISFVPPRHDRRWDDAIKEG